MSHIKTNEHNFVLMNDMGITKEYLCSKCKAKAVFNIIPRRSICHDGEKLIIVENCCKEEF